jgi:hypothetical protein
MADHPEVILGGKSVPVYPQRHAYLSNRLGKFIDLLSGQADDLDSVQAVVGILGDSVYDLLSALIPSLSKRITKYEWAGYGSQEAYDKGEYDEREDNSPTVPEIIGAFEEAIRVNRFDVFKALGQFVDPKALRASLSLWIAEQVSTASPSLPSISDGSTQSTSSGTTVPTSEDSEQPQSPSESESPNGSGSLLTTSA